MPDVEALGASHRELRKGLKRYCSITSNDALNGSSTDSLRAYSEDPSASASWPLTDPDALASDPCFGWNTSSAYPQSLDLDPSTNAVCFVDTINPGLTPCLACLRSRSLSVPCWTSLVATLQTHLDWTILSSRWKQVICSVLSSRQIHPAGLDGLFVVRSFRVIRIRAVRSQLCPVLDDSFMTSALTCFVKSERSTSTFAWITMKTA